MTKELTTKKVPTLQDLYSDSDFIGKNNQLNIILNAEPKKEWIKELNGIKYLPIERHEYLLTMVFSKWRVEIKDTKVLANSLVSVVRVWVKDPITGEWDYQDGVGAMPIQTARGAGALDFDKMNSKAIQMGAPASEAFAFKDACEKFGRVFGKDLNRKDNINYDRLYSMIEIQNTLNNPTVSNEVREEVLATTNEADLNKVYAKYSGLGKEFDKLVVEHREFIKNADK